MNKTQGVIFSAVVALLLLCYHGIGHATNLVAHNGRNELVLTPAKCEHAEILARIADPKFQPRFHAGRAFINGQHYEACWMDTGAGSYIVFFDDGDVVGYPVGAFVADEGI